MGKLKPEPEAEIAPARFRPASQLDFGRYAKSLAKVLECKLQDAQQVLARMYGYADLHELQQALKTESSPGPFSDRAASAELRLARDERTMRCVFDWLAPQKDRYLQNRDALACDLGLFLSPPAHRTAAARVMAYLEDGNGGFTYDGLPFGFSGTIHVRYHWHLPLADEAFRKFEFDARFPFGGRDFVLDPRAQLRRCQNFRAPHIFLNMATKEPDEHIELNYDLLIWSDDDAHRLLQESVDSHIVEHLLSMVDSPDPDDGEVDRALEVLADPRDENIRSCELTRSVPGLREAIPGWRYSLRRQLANYIVHEAPGNGYEGPPEAMVVTSGREEHVMSILLERQFCDLNIVLWRVNATLIQLDAATSQWNPTGCLAGNFVVPFDNEAFSDPEDVKLYFDDSDQNLYEAWLLLLSTYFARAGVTSYKEWVNDEAPGIAQLWPMVAKEHRGKGVTPILLKDFVDAFQEGFATAWDSDWPTWGDLNIGSSDWYEETEYPLPELGVVFVPLDGTGALGLSVWDGDAERPTGQLLRSEGQSLRRMTRGMRNHRRPEDMRKGLAWHLIKSVEDVSSDFVFYDPASVGKTEEDD